MKGRTSNTDISVSFELFPPKTDDATATLRDTVDRLTAVGPEYFSVTYGAGGTTRERTRRIVDMVADQTDLPVAHHLTCVGASKGEIDDQARALWEAGIHRIVALRGDIPEGDTLAEDGYNDAAELVAGLKRIGDFDIAVAAYPEVHPEASSPDGDIDHLKRKLDAGATKAITQFAFDTDRVLSFIDRARDAGVTAPIVPGIMPVANFTSLKRFSAGCGANIPEWMAHMFDGLDDEPRMRDMVAATVATEQCRRFVEAGVTDFHIYTLNRAPVSLAICRSLGLSTAAGTKRAA